MRVLIDIQDPIPPWVNASYGNFGFYKFGLCCWVYGGYDGAIEWINTKHYATIPKMAGATSFRWWFQQGVIAKVTPTISINRNIPPITIGGVTYNPVDGEGMPLQLPF